MNVGDLVRLHTSSRPIGLIFHKEVDPRYPDTVLYSILWNNEVHDDYYRIDNGFPECLIKPL